RSAPTQNDGPSPVSTIPRRDRSVALRRSSSANATIISGTRALWRSGRPRRRTLIPACILVGGHTGPPLPFAGRGGPVCPPMPLHACEDDRLLLGVKVEHFGAVLLAVAAVLGAAEGQLVDGDLDRVHPGVTGVQLVDRALSLAHIAGKDRRAEPELRIVGLLDRLVEVL